MTNDRDRNLRWPWLIFAVLLVAGLMMFTLSVNWLSQSWLDVTAFIVSAVSVLGVFLYASGREPSLTAFWRQFRWIFIVVVTSQSFGHALQAAKHRGFTTAGTAAFLIMVAITIGWIYALQWIAMSRLAREN